MNELVNEIVLMADPRVAAIPVAECGEPLVDVRREGSLLVDTRKQDPATAFAHLRKGVLQRLIEAQSLLPQGLRLLFVEGYRPPSLQRTYFEEYAAERIHSAASATSPQPRSPSTAPASTSLWPNSPAASWTWASA